jgi:hypothetical protein
MPGNLSLRRRCERASGAGIRNENRFLRREYLCGLGHEVNTRLHDSVGLGFRSLARQLKRVAHEIGDAMKDFRRHVVMREDHRVLAAFDLVDSAHIGSMNAPLELRNDMGNLGVNRPFGAGGGSHLNRGHLSTPFVPAVDKMLYLSIYMCRRSPIKGTQHSYLCYTIA